MNSSGEQENPVDELPQLVRLLHETQQRILELTGGEIDAVIHPSGSSYLLARAQQQLIESETRYRRLFNDIPLPMWVYDTETLKFLAVNRAAVQQYGYSAEEFLSMSITDVHPADHAAPLLASLRDRRHEPDHTWIWRHQLKNGRQIDVEVSSHAIEFSSRAARMVVATDITQRLEAAAAIHALARQQQAVALLGQRALLGIELRSLWQEALSALTENLGTEYGRVLQLLPNGALRAVAIAGWPADLLGVENSGDELFAQGGYTLKVGAPVVVEDLRTETRFSGAGLLARGIVSGISTMIAGSSMTWGVLSAHSAYPRHFSADDVAFFQGVANVLGAAVQRSEGEQALQEMNEKLRISQRLMANAERIAHLGSWDLELATGRLTWSVETYHIFGVTPDSFDGRYDSFMALVHPDDRARLEAEHNQVLASGLMLDTRYRIRRPDGVERTVDERGEVIFDSAGQQIRHTGIVIDITERLALEEQLRQAQRLEAVGQLTGGVAHDFNNLLTVIMGNAELIAEDLADDAQLQPLAAMVVTAAERGAELTRRLLAFARRQTLDPQTVDVNALVREMKDLLQRTLGEHIEIEIDYAADLWHALVDPAQLESALLNLCLNARDAMPGGGRLIIETDNIILDEAYAEQHVDVSAGAYVLLAVSDTGVGIAPEHLARVFEPFFTTKEKGKGTGLGLSMVYGFIKQSRGHINLYSEPGHGTTVRIYLPRAEGGPNDRAILDRHWQRVGGDETILLVEDDELVRRYVQQQIESLGYRVLAAADGPAALAILRERSDIMLLFTDIVMPGGMTGRALAEAARALRPDLRILYTSGYTDSAIGRHDRFDAEIPLLSKPYRSADLAQYIREALE